ncbi:N-formylglutamate amidohydrolase [Rufibacter ruber]|uniref:N-formylglutamate amidohydrolase n=1 Tax=Rufibacter ruber TaxID=1783499 RepID=UPI0009ED96C7|nr:N-formylglutamate amidohydrolase [Rufibacter ruber]
MNNAAEVKVLVTCEHGGNEIPRDYSQYFTNAQQVLQSHRGYDIGALELFHQFIPTAHFSTFSTTSRLLVELNRSEHHPQLFSEFTQKASPAEKTEILATHYHPYRQLVEQKVQEWVAGGGPVLHLSVHSFTPELMGKERKADISLLYDPAREREQLFSARWRQLLEQEIPGLRVRYNYPYKGTADGLVTHLRRRFSPRQYAGLELEVNQRFPEQGLPAWPELQQALVKSFSRAL